MCDWLTFWDVPLLDKMMPVKSDIGRMIPPAQGRYPLGGGGRELGRVAEQANTAIPRAQAT